MIEQTQLAGFLGNLISWLESWCDDQGAYNGFVVHRTEAKRMGQVHDTAWSQSAMIRGYGNLYRKSGEERWRSAITQAADLLASRYDPETGRMRHTGHEDERFQSLVSCALGVCALLSIADLADKPRKQKYIALCADHARRYWINVLWVDSEGAFKFSEVDFYSPGENRYVVNFNAMAAAALLAIHAATGDNIFRDYALKVGDWLQSRWSETQSANDKLLRDKKTLADDPDSCWMPPGGFSYQFTDSNRTPDNYVTLYNGLTLRGLRALYSATEDARYAEMIKGHAAFLLAMRDPQTRLFYHTTANGKIEKNPQFIAGAGMLLVGLHDVRELIGEKAIPEDTVAAILRKSHPNGSIPGFIGKNDTGHFRRDTGGQVWEDVAASVNWNAQLFEYLTRLVDKPTVIPDMTKPKTVCVRNHRFVYRDSPNCVQIISWWPPRSWGVYFYKKKGGRALLCFFPVGLRATLRNILKTILHRKEM
jgi:hypothetical protein